MEIYNLCFQADCVQQTVEKEPRTLIGNVLVNKVSYVVTLQTEKEWCGEGPEIYCPNCEGPARSALQTVELAVANL